MANWFNQHIAQMFEVNCVELAFLDEINAIGKFKNQRTLLIQAGFRGRYETTNIINVGKTRWSL